MANGMMQKAEIRRADERSAIRRMNPIRRIALHSHSAKSPKNGDISRWLTLRSSALHLAFCLFSAFCYAEELTDPTRPPLSIAAPTVAGGAEAPPTPAGLQSIIISKTRRAAIIDGETVELGGKHGDAKLIEVNEGGVVLRGAQGRQVMTLFPDVKITGKQEAGKAARKERK